MRNIEKIVKKQRAKMQPTAPAAGGPDKGKVEILATEIIENRKAMDKIEAKENAVKAAKEKAAKEQEARAAKEAKETLASELEVHTTKPIVPTHMDCPFCGEEKTIRGTSRHIKSIHGVPGVSLEDLGRIERGEISPDALATEKGITEIFGLSPEVDEKYFSNWEDTEEDPRDLESQEDPEGLADPKDQENPEKEAGENGAGGGIPSFLFWILAGAGIAGMILLRIPKYKEKGENLLAYLGTLGSKGSPDSKGPGNFNPSFGQGGFNRRF